jgi:hypothetical protein
MSTLGGSSAAGVSAGSSGAGPAAGVGARVPDGGGSAPEPNGGVTLLGRLYAGTPLPEHDHEAPSTGGVIDYARLLVSATEPAAPPSPSDAFWLNPSEVA